MNLALIGMRGVGKSNISRRLSFLSKRPVLATDVLAEYETGMDIPTYVADSGWPAFRDLEYRILQRLAGMACAIVDCGGGIIVDLAEDGAEVFSDRKVSALRSQGPVVWLRGDVSRLVAKTAADPRRPTLDETRSAMDLMQRRIPFYEAAADLVIDVDDRKRSELAIDLALRFTDVLGIDDELRTKIRQKQTAG